MALSTLELLNAAMPMQKGCCSQRRWELQRINAEEWIKANRHLSDEKIIEKLKKRHDTPRIT